MDALFGLLSHFSCLYARFHPPNFMHFLNLQNLRGSTRSMNKPLRLAKKFWCSGKVGKNAAKSTWNRWINHTLHEGAPCHLNSDTWRQMETSSVVQPVLIPAILSHHSTSHPDTKGALYCLDDVKGTLQSADIWRSGMRTCWCGAMRRLQYSFIFIMCSSLLSIIWGLIEAHLNT